MKQTHLAFSHRIKPKSGIQTVVIVEWVSLLHFAVLSMNEAEYKIRSQQIPFIGTIVIESEH
jgi:hypothetical protein